MRNIKRDYTIAVLDTSLNVLETFVRFGGGDHSISEIADYLGCNRSRTFRILQTLERHGFVEQNLKTRKYRLGMKLLALGEMVLQQLDPVETAKPVMADLAMKTKATACLGIREGSESVYVAIQKWQDGSGQSEVGKRISLAGRGLSQVLIAFTPAEEQSKILQQLGQNAAATIILDREQLQGAWDRVRSQGYALDDHDLQSGAHSVAAPIYNHTGQVIAALGIEKSNGYFDGAYISDIVQQLTDAAANISARLGYQLGGHPRGQTSATADLEMA
ncbi:MAG: IclR family transcriptional regulator [Chloroflexi bacterium]|nr:IclR family transcriptional regulator [Chloroflexota bacterium]